MADGFSTWVTIGKKRSSKRIEKERNQRRRRMVHGVVNFLVSIVCIPFEKKKRILDVRNHDVLCSQRHTVKCYLNVTVGHRELRRH